MNIYLPDTNVIANYGRDPATKAKIDRASASGSKFVIAPPTMTELTVGVMKGGATWFAQNKVNVRMAKVAICKHPRPSAPLHGQGIGFPL